MTGMVTALAFWFPWSIGAILILLYLIVSARSAVMALRYAVWQQVYNIFWETKLWLRLKVFLWDFRSCFRNPDGFTRNMNRNATAWPKCKSANAVAPSTKEGKT